MCKKVFRRANLNCCLFARLLQVVNIYKANCIIRAHVLLCDKILLYRKNSPVDLEKWGSTILLSTYDNKRKWYKVGTYGLISQRQLSRFPVRDVHRGQEKMWKYKRIDWFVVIDNKAKLRPISAPRLIQILRMNVFDKWMNEWMNEWMNGNECGEAWKVIGMKRYVRISRFAHFKRLCYRQTDRQTDRLTWPLIEVRGRT